MLSLRAIGCNFMMRLRDLNLPHKTELSPQIQSIFHKYVLTRRAIISLKKINSLQEETMKAITKQLSINQLRSFGEFSLVLTSFNASTLTLVPCLK